MVRIRNSMLLIAVFAMLLLFQDYKKSDAAETDADIVHKGDIAPIFEFAALDGKKHKLEEFKGKVVLLNFFATWCGPCRVELPHLEAIWGKHKRDGLIVISIAREETLDKIKGLVAEKKLTYLVGEDPSRAIYSKYAKQSIPRNYLIDADGKIVFCSMGASDELVKELSNQVSAALEKNKNAEKSGKEGKENKPADK
jgi:peroxiredoxin